MIRPTYPLETPRLLLRPLRDEDFDALLAINSRPDVVRYLYEEPRTADEVRRIIAERKDNTALEQEGDHLSLGVEIKGRPGLIGTGMLQWTSEKHQSGEVGYVLHPDHHGHGYATEIAVRLIDLGFREGRLHRIIGRLDARNTASARVLEKSGMRHEAHLVENEWVKGEWTDEAIYAMLYAEWEKAQG